MSKVIVSEKKDSVEIRVGDLFYYTKDVNEADINKPFMLVCVENNYKAFFLHKPEWFWETSIEEISKHIEKGIIIKYSKGTVICLEQE